jgi:hypothetical protein
VLVSKSSNIEWSTILSCFCTDSITPDTIAIHAKIPYRVSRANLRGFSAIVFTIVRHPPKEQIPPCGKR